MARRATYLAWRKQQAYFAHPLSSLGRSKECTPGQMEAKTKTCLSPATHLDPSSKVLPGADWYGLLDSLTRPDWLCRG